MYATVLESAIMFNPCIFKAKFLLVIFQKEDSNCKASVHVTIQYFLSVRIEHPYDVQEPLVQCIITQREHYRYGYEYEFILFQMSVLV